MKQTSILFAALLLSFNAFSQVAGTWSVTDHPADELKGTEAYQATSFVSDAVTFTVFSNDSTVFLIGSPDGIFKTNTYTTDNVKVIVGLYDTNMHLVRKLEQFMFTRLDNMNYIRGKVHHPNMNKRWVACHFDLNRYVTQEVGYIRILSQLTDRQLDVTIPTVKQAAARSTH